MENGSMHPEYLLKIFSGPHLGAEILLDGQEISLGSDPDCDIVLTDVLLSCRHLRLFPRENGVVLVPEPNCAGIWVKGRPIARETEVFLENFQLVVAGTTCFGIGPVGSPWPRVELPSVWPGGSTELESENTEAATGTRSGENPSISLPLTRKPIWIPASIGGVLLAGVIWMLWHPISTAPPPLSRPISEIFLQTRLKSAGFANLTIDTSEAGTASVSGYVSTLAEKKQIAELLQTDFPSVSLRVRAMDQLVAACRETAMALNATAEIQGIGMGKIRITGFFPSNHQQKQLMEMIYQEIPGIREIEDRTLTPALIRNDLSGLIARAGLQDQIKTTLYPSYILAEGSVSENQMAGWQGVKDGYLSQYGKYFPLKDSIMGHEISPSPIFPPVSAPTLAQETTGASPLHLDIGAVAVGFGSIRYVKTGNGHTCFEGGELPNGYRIVSIQPSQVVLQKDGTTRVFGLWR